MKPYKAKPPVTTINDIRNILEKCSIFTIEKHFGMDNDLDVFSCRVFVANDNLQGLDIGMNGKGVTPAYSLASGYAEFMERLQFGTIFPSFMYYFEKKQKENSSIKKIISKSEELDFCYAPDEKTVTFKELSSSCPEEVIELLKALLRHDKRSLWETMTQSNPSFISAPFFNLNRKKVVDLPIDLVRVITGSNGTCAGNTPEEALVHGLCEIFERFAAKKIFSENIIPPDIPHSFFKGTLSEKIIGKIKESGNYDIRIKDCSLGLGIPVIGMLFIDRDLHKYLFRLGSDPRPEIALERCLTEAYQGLDSIKAEMLPIEETMMLDHSSPIHGTTFRENYIKFVTNGKGLIPNALFKRQSTYSFKGFDSRYGKSDSEDLQLLTDKIISLGYSVFIRDHSFLDFPTYHVFVPGMSDIYGNFTSLPHESYSYYETMCNLKIETDDNLLKLAKYAESITDNETKLGMFFSAFSPPFSKPEFENTDRCLFIAMIYCKLGRFKDAYQWMKKHIELDVDNLISNKTYFNCTRDYLKFISEGSSTDETRAKLSHLYDKEMVNEVMEDLKEPHKIFNYYNLPSCFECDSCDASQNCHFNDIYSIFLNIKKKQKENLPDQTNLLNLFTK